MNAKQRWISNHYAKIQVAVPKELAADFKQYCATKGISVAGEATDLIRKDLRIPIVGVKRSKSSEPKFDTRSNRRKVIQLIIHLVEETRDAELAYQESIPDSLQDTNGEGIDDAVESLENVIQELSSIEIFPEPPVKKTHKKAKH
jgi:hypothetical protein